MCFFVYYFEEFILGRFFIKKLKNKINESINLYVSNNGKVVKMNLTQIINNYTKTDEKYLDLCILSKNID